MNLKEYLKVVKMKPMAFARICDLNNNFIYKALAGKHRIDLRTALIIEKITNGDVSLIELCDEEFQEKIKKLQTPFKKIRKAP